MRTPKFVEDKDIVPIIGQIRSLCGRKSWSYAILQTFHTVCRCSRPRGACGYSGARIGFVRKKDVVMGRHRPVADANRYAAFKYAQQLNKTSKIFNITFPTTSSGFTHRGQILLKLGTLIA